MSTGSSFASEFSSRHWCQDIVGGEVSHTDTTSQHDSEPVDQKQSTAKSPSQTSQSPRQNITIPKFIPMSSTESPPAIAQGLEGKFVDEFGNILGWDGTVLGRAEGDLPSMVERPISIDGKIRDSSGQVVGYVSENLTKPITAERGCGLRVDETGNIYDQDGAVVGRMKKPADPNAAHGTPFGQAKKGSENSRSQQDSHTTPRPQATPDLSELSLDIKSTHDGIQLIIKIPTCLQQRPRS